ncbi:MAG: putative baseplate protein J [Prokaryotic dsDNA virus sp.]|mgnify:CR=1 FL=1|nr:hypothetical protein [Phycisphaerae bacterium]QDP45989.1 MAG: putative baseplate protein J [Prokaryotic dsDNA virus sp.]|tara:strand:+ start:31734 stop:32912 length:1179 start_codon:yes stop_codon:yes gene_type:complete
MANTIEDTGFSRTRYQDLRIEKEQQYKDGFSNQELKTDVQSGVGQEISVSTFAEDDLASRFQTLLSAFDPVSAQGVLMSRLAILMNKRRQDATSSTATISITATAAGATVPIDFQVSNTGESATFKTTAETIIAPSSTADIELTATETGAIEAAAGTLTVIKTPVFGVDSVVNSSDASVGRKRETVTELRGRCLGSSAKDSSTKIGILSALSDVDGVTGLDCIVNDKGVIDADGVPPKSVFPIIEGGADSDIARALISTVAGGIGYAEQTDIPAATIVSGSYTDPITQQPQTAYWARVDSVRVYCEVNLTKLSSYPADGDARVKGIIEDWVIENMSFGEDLYASQIYCPIQEIEGAIVVSVFVGLAASPSGSIIPISTYEKASILISDIDIP